MNGFSVDRGDQRDEPVLNSGKQCVLLRLGKPVHLVDEQHGLPARHAELAPRVVDGFADVLHSRIHRRQLNETAGRRVAYDVRECGLSGSGAGPQKDRTAACIGILDHASKRRSGRAQFAVGPRPRRSVRAVASARRGVPPARCACRGRIIEQRQCRPLCAAAR